MPLQNSGSPRAHGRTPPVQIPSPSREDGGPSQAKGGPVRNGYRGQSPARQPTAHRRDGVLREYAPRWLAEFRPLTTPRGSALNRAPGSGLARSIQRSFQSLRASIDSGGTVLSDTNDKHLRRVHPSRPSPQMLDRKSTRLNSSHVRISYAVFCLKK